mmetsp:Transcript_25506/g.46119  ORF Transcript_25506/g.46119 Transcript_25506/m.46119 type:complete len:162 (-) Transcript_25506:166-651(-)
MAGDCLDRMITGMARSSVAKRVANERKRKGGTVVENLKEAKRLPSGVLAKHGIHSLNDPRFQFANFTLTECGTYLQYKKTSSKDPGMPKDLRERGVLVVWNGCIALPQQRHLMEVMTRVRAKRRARAKKRKLVIWMGLLLGCWDWSLPLLALSTSNPLVMY